MSMLVVFADVYIFHSLLPPHTICGVDTSYPIPIYTIECMVVLPLRRWQIWLNSGWNIGILEVFEYIG